jgi:biotin synthase
MHHPAIEQAYAIIEGKTVKRSVFSQLSLLEGDDILDLAALASRVRNRFTPDFHLCTIMNAKSGICGEDCRFCAQSAHHDTAIDRFPLVNRLIMVDKAGEAYSSGVETFGIVTSGTGYPEINSEFQELIGAIDEIHQKYPDKKVCASLGLLSDMTAMELAKHDVSHYNINIQTNPAKYRELVSSTHDISDRIETIRLLKKHGIKVCTGGIIGMGETMEDRLEMAFALNDLDADIIPVNVLIPVPGTPLERQGRISAADAVKTVALVRLINPTKTIKFAAGRETRMKDFQGLIMLAGANGIITGGYLTTRGREVREDLAFIRDLGAFK